MSLSGRHWPHQPPHFALTFLVDFSKSLMMSDAECLILTVRVNELYDFNRDFQYKISR